MNRWLLIGSLTGLMALSTGCLHHNTRGGCQSCGTANAGMPYAGQCSSGQCSSGQCSSGQCGSARCTSCQSSPRGLLVKARGKLAGCYTGSNHACNGACQSGHANCPGGRV